MLNNAILNIGSGSEGAGTFLLQGSSDLTGDVAAAQHLRIQGGAANASIVAANGFQNRGTIDLESTSAGSGSATLIVNNNGVLDNQSELNLKSGTGSNKARALTGNLDNYGTVNIESGVAASFGKNYGVYANKADTAEINIASGATLGLGSWATFSLEKGVVNNEGTFSLNYNTLNFNGGSFAGNAPVLNNSLLSIGSGSEGAGTFLLQGSSDLKGDVAAAQHLRIQGGAANASIVAANGFQNRGTIDLESTSAGSGSATLIVNNNGVLDNRNELNLKSGTGSNKARALTGNLDNYGTVNIESGVAASFGKNYGVYANKADAAAINIASGATLGLGSWATFSLEKGVVNNEGTFGLNYNTLNFNGGSFAGNAPVLNNSILSIGSGSEGAGTFLLQGSSDLKGDVAAAQHLRIQGGAANASIVAANGFQNRGTIDLESTSAGSGSATLIVNNNGVLDNQSELNLKSGTGSNKGRSLYANLDNYGTVNIESGVAASFGKNYGVYANKADAAAINIASGATLGLGSWTTFSLEKGVVNNEGAFNLSYNTLNFNGGSFAGNAPVLHNSILNIGSGSEGAGTFLLQASSDLTGDVAAAQHLRLQGGAANASIVAANGFQNRGTIDLESTSAGSGSASLTLNNNGTLDNHGQLRFAKGTGSQKNRYLNANLNNEGTVTVENDVSTTFNKAYGTILNSGIIQLGGASATLVTYNEIHNTAAGVIRGNGTIERQYLVGSLNAVYNEGLLMPGASPGCLKISGDFLNTGTAALAFEVGGTSPGTTFDLLDVDGKLTLGGCRLQVSLYNGFVPSATDFFDIIVADTLVGAFGNLDPDGRVVTCDGRGSFLVETAPVSGRVAIRLSRYISQAVPESGSALSLLGIGLGALAASRRRHS